MSPFAREGNLVQQVSVGTIRECRSNPHVHVLMLDGVYVSGDEAPVFVAAPPLSDPEVQQIVETSARRIIRLCTRHGLLDDTQARSARLPGDRAGGSGPLAPVPSAALPRGSGPRARIVPAKPVEASAAAAHESSAPSCAHRLGWAALLARSIGKMRHLFGPLVNAPNTPKGHRVSLLIIVCRSLGRARSTVWLSVGPYRVQSGTR